MARGRGEISVDLLPHGGRGREGIGKTTGPAEAVPQAAAPVRRNVMQKPEFFLLMPAVRFYPLTS